MEFLISWKFGFSFKANLFVEFLKNIEWEKNGVKKLLIWTNVASTNVALANDIVIVDIS